MYRRYENNNTAKVSSRPANDAGAAFRRSQNRRDDTAYSQSHSANNYKERNYEHRREHTSHNRNVHHRGGHNHPHNHRRDEHNHTHHRHNDEHNHNHHSSVPPKNNKNPILGFIPSSIYNPENGKIFGFLSAEDLLLIAMILIFLDSDEDGDNLMVYALLYVLASEWIDIGDFFR